MHLRPPERHPPEVHICTNYCRLEPDRQLVLETSAHTTS